jgi:putative transposase
VDQGQGWARHPGLLPHSDKGVSYRAVRYNQRLADAQAVASVGFTGHCYDNALAGALDSLLRAEPIRSKASGSPSTTSN